MNIDAGAPAGDGGDGERAERVAGRNDGERAARAQAPRQPAPRRTIVVPVASFHLVRRRPRAAARALLDVPRLRARLCRTEGLRFWRLLGTGHGDSMTLSADLGRWALFAVWDGDAALGRFLASGAVSRRWDAVAAERWDCRLELAAARGAWGGVSLVPAHADRVAGAGCQEPVAVLTRASIRLGALAAFYRGAAAVEHSLRAAPGRLRSVGAGEWPVGRQATFSLWRSAADALAFAYGADAHAEVVRRTRTQRWYAEELFARFLPETLRGAWDGADPLARP